MHAGTACTSETASLDETSRRGFGPKRSGWGALQEPARMRKLRVALPPRDRGAPLGRVRASDTIVVGCAHCDMPYATPRSVKSLGRQTSLAAQEGAHVCMCACGHKPSTRFCMCCARLPPCLSVSFSVSWSFSVSMSSASWISVSVCHLCFGSESVVESALMCCFVCVSMSSCVLQHLVVGWSLVRS